MEAEAEKQSGEARAENGEGLSKKRKHRRFIKSITGQTTLNYIVFALILIGMLWGAFFTSLYAFYGSVLEKDFESAGRAAGASFRLEGDDERSKQELMEISHKHSLTIVFFTRAGEGFETLEQLDPPSDSAGGAFASLMEQLEFPAFFDSRDDIKHVRTSEDDFLVYGSYREAAGERIYMLAIKRYAIFDTQTVQILWLFIMCTVVVLIVACIFSFVVSRFQMKRLKDFSERAKRIAEGDRTVEFNGDGFDEYENLARALNDAKDSLQRTEDLRRDLIANVSHDIRTPLTMIRAYAEMLRDMPLDNEKRERTAQVIISEADRLNVLTDDILNYSRLQSGVAEFKFQKNDISLIATAVLEQFTVFRERDGMKILSDVEKKTFAVCDEQRIRQVLYNLLINAVNFCGDDKTVLLRVMNIPGRVRVEVTDNGSGIAESELEAVWERYYRSAHAKRSAVGSGLGLSICKNILDAHKANYGVLSTLGNGTTFWFELDVKG